MRFSSAVFHQGWPKCRKRERETTTTATTATATTHACQAFWSLLRRLCFRIGGRKTEGVVLSKKNKNCVDRLEVWLPRRRRRRTARDSTSIQQQQRLELVSKSRRDCQDLVLEEKLIIWKAIHWLFWQEKVETMADAKQQGDTERTLGQKRFARLWSHVWTLDIKTNSTKTPPRWFPCVSFSRSTACSWAASSPSCPSCGWLSSSTLSHRHHQIR